LIANDAELFNITGIGGNRWTKASQILISGRTASSPHQQDDVQAEEVIGA
jgi:hypothetical protein